MKMIKGPMNQRLIDKLMEHAKNTASLFNTNSANRFESMIKSQAYQTLDHETQDTKKNHRSLRETKSIIKSPIELASRRKSLEQLH